MEKKFLQLKQDPIFIIGAARSGTTWMYDIFTAHPEVTGVFESWLFTRDNGLGSLFSAAHWPPKHSGLGRYLTRDEVLTFARETAQAILGEAIEPGHHYLVEKSPSHLYAMELIAEIFPEARFIHVLRDGRDVCVSVRAAARSWMPDWKRTFGGSMEASAKSWHDAVRRARNDGKNLGDRFMEIRYETLKADPIAAYKQLFDFCGIPCTDEILQNIFEKTDFNLNFKGNESGFRRGGRTGDWYDSFSLIDAYKFHRTAGGLLEDIGYAEDKNWWWKFWWQRLQGK